MDPLLITLLSVLQAVAAANPQPITTDSCNPKPGGEIVICGSRTGESPYRLPKLPDKYERKPLRAETDAIPGVHTQAHVESETNPDGSIAKRLMLTFKVPF
jgi:hypothetical protein